MGAHRQSRWLTESQFAVFEEEVDIDIAVRVSAAGLLGPLVVLITSVPAPLGIGLAELLRDLVAGHPALDGDEVFPGDRMVPDDSPELVLALIFLLAPILNSASVLSITHRTGRYRTESGGQLA